MDKLEKVEKLIEKTGVSYEEAKLALEANNEDILDAIIFLERAGKAKAPDVESYVTGSEQPKYSAEFEQAQEEYQKDSKKKAVGGAFDGVLESIGKIFKKCIDTKFKVIRNDKVIIQVPVLLLIISIIGAFWVTVPILIIGLFCECQYHLEGLNQVSVDVNGIFDKASQTCEDIKSDMRNKED